MTLRHILVQFFFLQYMLSEQQHTRINHGNQAIVIFVCLETQGP